MNSGIMPVQNFNASSKGNENFGKKVLKCCADAVDDFTSKTGDPYIRVDGKKYYVDYSNPDAYPKGSVTVDGKKYRVFKAPGSLGSSGNPANVVFVNGKSHVVKGGERYPGDERPMYYPKSPDGNI